MQFRRQAPEPASLNLTPLIDVVFLLLIFFMVSTTFPSSRMQVQLPQAASGQVRHEPSPWVLSIDAQGHFMLEDRPLNDLTALSQALSDYRKQVAREGVEGQAKTAPVLEIRADKQVPYQRVIDVLDLAAQLNIQQVRFATQPIQPRN